VKLETNYLPGEISIEQKESCKITRCIYHFQPSNFLPLYCLLRIFEFSSKTVVIASHLRGAILWNETLIENIIEDFNLNCDNLFWINHVGLFSDYMPIEERFLHTTFSFRKESRSSQIKIDLQDENKIDTKSVQTLTGLSLEPVESWIGLDAIAEKNLKSKKAEIVFQLFHLYLQENKEYLLKQEKIIRALAESQLGAFFFYPNQDKAIEFIKYKEIFNNSYLKQKALPYIDKSYPDEEIVICICIDNHDPFCTILKKESFLEPFEIEFVPIKKLVEYTIKSSSCKKFNLEQYKQINQVKEERLHSLLGLYLEPNLNYLKSRYEKEKLIFESELETLRGVLFYQPQSKYCEFSPLKEFLCLSERSAVPYIETYNVETEFVICVCFDMDQSICGIFPR